MYGDTGLPDNSIEIKVQGSAGQSFCAFLVRGISVLLEGDANDYVGKGLTGGEVILYPPKDLPTDFHSELNVIAGNACLYGATSGKAFFRGIVAERFAVRNSGAWAICEGVGDHGCEYMTGGQVVVLGLTGRNFAAGMSGGIAYVMNKDGEFPTRCNINTVDLLPVSLEEDMQFLKDFIAEFRDKTGSVVAGKVLSEWPESLKLFIKVFPKDYQKALQNASSEAVHTSATKLDENALSNGEIVQDVEDILREKNIDKTRGFVKYKREVNHYRPPEERIKDYEEIYDHKSVRKTLKVQSARCMDCGVPFCQSNNGCPLGNIIPKWNDLVFQDNWKEALDQLLLTNNFPEFTGRVCPAPCESACVLSLIEPPVTIKNIECAIIEKGFEEGFVQPVPPASRSVYKVAIIGSGPTGLAAAAQLNKAGHSVVVYERSPKIGGLLRYGIPSMKLNREVIDRRLSLMEKEGITFKVNQNIGEDVKIQQLLSYDAILLATGSTRPRKLPIPGHDLNGIHFAMDYLYKSQRCQELDDQSFRAASGKDVLVIGGGDTGVDCIATALREGAKSVTTLELLSKPPDNRASGSFWPKHPRTFKVEYGHADVKAKFGADPRVYNLLPKRYLGDEHGKVSGIEVSEIAWKKDSLGRWQGVETKDSEKIIKTDFVLLALGFLGPENKLLDQLNVKLDLRCNIDTSPVKYQTSVRRIYAAGDCRIGQSLVVTAIAEGRQAARQIDEDLTKRSFLAGPGGVISQLSSSSITN